MEISQLRYFLDVAQTQHITKSSQRLRISQPALTKAIHKLEDELGVPLFTHTGRNIMLTQYGMYLKSKLAPIVSRIDAIPEEIAEMSRTENHTVRLSVLAASAFVTGAIIEYRKKYPKINFHVLQNPDNEPFDIEITTGISEISGTEEDGESFVCTEELFAAVPDTEKYRHRKTAALRELAAEGFVSLPSSRQLRNICDEFCRRAGFEANVILESDSPYAVQNMIAARLGIGFWPEFTWGKIGNGGVKLLRLTDPACKRSIVVKYKSLKADDTYSRNFYEFLIRYFQNRGETAL